MVFVAKHVESLGVAFDVWADVIRTPGCAKRFATILIAGSPVRRRSSSSSACVCSELVRGWLID